MINLTQKRHLLVVKWYVLTVFRLPLNPEWSFLCHLVWTKGIECAWLKKRFTVVDEALAGRDSFHLSLHGGANMWISKFAKALFECSQCLSGPSTSTCPRSWSQKLGLFHFSLCQEDSVVPVEDHVRNFVLNSLIHCVKNKGNIVCPIVETMTIIHCHLPRQSIAKCPPSQDG